MSDCELLRRYIRSGSDRAFAELTGKYRRLVFSTCLREVHDYSIAEDVAQSVFVLLARKPPKLAPGASIGRWLFHSSRLLAKNESRNERRRRSRETYAGLDVPAPIEQRPSLVSSLIDDALATLAESETEVIFLRLIDGYSFPELGALLGLSEDAARKRFNRALERLRERLGVDGVGRTLNQTKGTLRTMLTDNKVVRDIDARYSGLDEVMASRDAEAVRAYVNTLYAPDFYAADEKGQRIDGPDNEGFVEYILNRPPEVERKHEIELIEAIGDTATVAVKLNVVREEAPSFSARFEDTWRRIDGSWQLAVTRSIGRQDFPNGQ